MHWLPRLLTPVVLAYLAFTFYAESPAHACHYQGCPPTWSDCLVDSTAARSILTWQRNASAPQTDKITRDYSLGCIAVLQAGPPAPTAIPTPAAVATTPPAAPPVTQPVGPSPIAQPPVQAPPSARVEPPPVPVAVDGVPRQLPAVPPVGPPRDGAPVPALTVDQLTIEGCRVETPRDPTLRAGCEALLKADAAKAEAQAQSQKPRAAEVRGELVAKGAVDSGKLAVIHAGETNETPVAVGSPIVPGDTVVTSAEGAAIAFDGGSRMQVGPNAQVKIADGSDASVEQKKGRVFYDIKSRQFRVKVDHPRGRYFIAVQGTQFTVHVAEDGSGAIQVTEGAVQVISADRTIEVLAGASATVAPGEPPSSESLAATSGNRVLLLSVTGALLLLVTGGTLYLKARGTRD